MSLLTIKKGSSDNLDSVSKIDGQLLITTDTKEIYLDDATKRILIGAGNPESIGAANINGDTFSGSIGLTGRIRYFGQLNAYRKANDVTSWTSGTDTRTPATNGAARFGFLGFAVPYAYTSTATDGTVTKGVSNPYAEIRLYGQNSTTGAITDYYYSFRTPAVSADLTENATRYLVSSSALARGGTDTPVYLKAGFLYTGSAYVPKSGGNFTGAVTINNATILTSDNFNTYAPKLDGTGATGLWEITSATSRGISVQMLGSGIDLNNLYSGFFGMAVVETAQAYTNNPLSSKSTGILVKNYYVDGIYYQEVTGTLDGGMYKRRKSGDTWSSWIQMATTADNVASATKLATGRTLKVNLASTAASTAFNGTANITDIGVAGALSIANGGTGSTTAAAARTALGITPANIGAATSSHTHNYLPLSGGTVTGTTTIMNIRFFNDTVTSGTSAGDRSVLAIMGTTYGNDSAYLKTAKKLSFGDPGPQIQFISGTNPASGQRAALIYTDHDTIGTGNSLSLVSTETSCRFIAPLIYGAVWNDYAEYRSGSTTEPGRVVQECHDGVLRVTTKRLEPACEIISDTFGFAIGETEECKTPIAATGRVLAYTDCDRYSFNLGDAVCSGENGTVSKMTREEIMTYPERIIGTVSEIPEYETWGTGNVKVNGRIWIRIR